MRTDTFFYLLSYSSDIGSSWNSSFDFCSFILLGCNCFTVHTVSSCGVDKVTFVLLLDLLVSSSLTKVRQDLRQLRNHNVVRGQSRLSLRQHRT